MSGQGNVCDDCKDAIRENALQEAIDSLDRGANN